MSNQQSQQNAAIFIKDVNILEAAFTNQLTVKIREALADGWVLHGDLMVAPDGILIQQVVKYDQRLTEMANLTMDLVTEQIKQFR